MTGALLRWTKDQGQLVGSRLRECLQIRYGVQNSHSHEQYHYNRIYIAKGESILEISERRCQLLRRSFNP